MLHELVPLNPIHFFAIQCNCHYMANHVFEEKHLLPNLFASQERQFAQVFMGWNEQGFFFQVLVNGSFHSPAFPKFMTADSVELFLDARDLKTTGFLTRYCHHFYFLPDPVQVEQNWIQTGEITRFRTDDMHELCDPNLLSIKVSEGKKCRTMHIFIPSECLHGYDPTEFDRLGFTYRINRVNGTRQYFSTTSEDFVIENQPSLWASLKLIKEKK